MPESSPEGSRTEVVAAVVTDGARTLFVADFDDTDTAWGAYQALRSLEDGRHLAVDGAVVVARGVDGTLEVQQATDHSTRRGLTWGVVGGAALGLLFPPSIIGSVAALGAGGAAVGKARQVSHRRALERDLGQAIAPGHSGIVALVSDPGAVEVRRALAKANGIVESAVDDVVATDIRALAAEVDKG